VRPAVDTSIAMSEIIRVAWWSLRAIGCPLGAVESMARILAYSEVLDGQTLSALRRNEKALLMAFAGEAPRFSAIDHAIGTIEASGRSMLDIGPRAVDLITGCAKRRGGSVRITIRRTADMIGWSGAATVAAQRGIGLMAIAGDKRRSWQFYVSGCNGDVTSVCGELNGTSPTGVMALMRELAGPSFAATMPSMGSVDGEAGTLDLIGFPFIADEKFLAGVSVLPGVVCRNVTRALANAYSSGVHVTSEDLRFLYELETRTWAPSSERSRSQAGFKVANAAT
jgi:hypothetical protein